jgi:hypothetical protein
MGSSDNAIKNEIPKDFTSFYNQRKNITTVFLSSKKAEDFYKRYIAKSPDRSYHVLPSQAGSIPGKLMKRRKRNGRLFLRI